MEGTTNSVEPSDKRRYKSYFTRAELAQLFEVAPNTVNRWVRGRKVPSVVTPGGRRRYPVEAILQLVKELKQGADTLSAEIVTQEKVVRRKRAGTRR